MAPTVAASHKPRAASPDELRGVKWKCSLLNTSCSGGASASRWRSRSGEPRRTSWRQSQRLNSAAVSSCRRRRPSAAWSSALLPCRASFSLAARRLRIRQSSGVLRRALVHDNPRRLQVFSVSHCRYLDALQSDDVGSFCPHISTEYTLDEWPKAVQNRRLKQ